MQEKKKRDIARKTEDFDRWYTDVILRAELADYAPVKGCMVIRPYGYAVWEGIQAFIDRRIKARGVENAYFPVFIPERFIKMEKEHVEGFSPHMAVVTEAGGEKLTEKLVVRPTSETVMYQMYKQWVHSWRELPILINQWNNIVRWEKRTYLFLRTSEFLWQEGHCAHETHQESEETVLWALDVYEKTYRELLAMYGIAGVKSDAERFAGGDKTYTVELLMPDGKALQGCTSHDLGQNFARAFDWTVQGKNGEREYPFQNSWGFTTRSIGGMIMVHGDDDGLLLPPAVAPVQVVIVPIAKTGESHAVTAYGEKLKEQLGEKGIRVRVDNREEKTAGWKFNEWEVKGVPVRLEIGKREVSQETVTCVRRDTGEKHVMSQNECTEQIAGVLREIQGNLFSRHKAVTQENTHIVDSYETFRKIMEEKKGFLRAFWCQDRACEEKIKQETKATTRCLPLKARKEKGVCISCGKPATHRWHFAQAY